LILQTTSVAFVPPTDMGLADPKSQNRYSLLTREGNLLRRPNTHLLPLRWRRRTRMQTTTRFMPWLVRS
jgi:hypothetical protein